MSNPRRYDEGSDPGFPKDLDVYVSDTWYSIWSGQSESWHYSDELPSVAPLRFNEFMNNLSRFYDAYDEHPLGDLILEKNQYVLEAILLAGLDGTAKDHPVNIHTGPQAGETIVNEHGAKQSHVPSRVDLLPSSAVLRVGEILASGAAKYGDDNWRNIPVREHLNHALNHVLEALKEFRTGEAGNEDHLANATTRMLFALEIALVGMDVERIEPK